MTTLRTHITNLCYVPSLCKTTTKTSALETGVFCKKNNSNKKNQQKTKKKQQQKKQRIATVMQLQKSQKQQCISQPDEDFIYKSRK